MSIGWHTNVPLVVVTIGPITNFFLLIFLHTFLISKLYFQDTFKKKKGNNSCKILAQLLELTQFLYKCFFIHPNTLKGQAEKVEFFSFYRKFILRASESNLKNGNQTIVIESRAGQIFRRSLIQYATIEYFRNFLIS